MQTPGVSLHVKQFNQQSAASVDPYQHDQILPQFRFTLTEFEQAGLLAATDLQEELPGHTDDLGDLQEGHATSPAASSSTLRQASNLLAQPSSSVGVERAVLVAPDAELVAGSLAHKPSVEAQQHNIPQLKQANAGVTRKHQNKWYHKQFRVRQKVL